MNKTVNINLAGIFFHIDEDAYSKLQRYLEAIKRSFTDSQGRSEIISDIEARIAELFTERVKHDKQVIGIKEVDEVITIMGQPEDYLVDDEIFEDEPSTKQRRPSSNHRKFFRDTDNSYVGGVSSGLGHYFGIDALWIRIAWLLLIFGAGTGIILYIILWILIPEAVSTSDKITMTGKPVNISNIEKKIRDGFQNASENVGTHLDKAGNKIKEGIGNASDSISEGVKNVDFNKQGNRIKSSSKTFFDTIADVIMFFLKLFAKFIGVILIITGASTIIGLFAGFLTLGLVDSIHFPGVDWLDIVNSTGIPIWGMSIILFFFFGIMAFFVLYLGLKILINNLKSIGVFAKSALLGVWLICLVSLIVLATKHGMSYKEEGAFITTQKYDTIKANDTLVITMKGNDYFSERFRRSYGYRHGFSENGDRVTYSQDIRISIKSTRDSVAKVKVTKTARGSDYEVAKNRAEGISYDYTLTDNVLELNNYFLISNDEPFKDQEIVITVYLPNGVTIFPDKSVHHYHIYRGLLSKVQEGYYYKLDNDSLDCINCPEEDIEDEDDEFKVRVDLNGDTSKLKINEDGLEAKTDNLELTIENNSVKAEGENVDVKIDDDGIEITSKKDKKSDE